MRRLHYNKNCSSGNYMDRKSTLREMALAAFIVLGAAAQGVNAQALQGSGASSAVVSQPGTSAALPDTSPQAGQADTTALTPDENRQSAAGNVAELQQMIRGSDLTELRTTYNGTYGASLLFYGKEMTYYVALFQQKNFWRVVKTQDDARAEAIYADFEKKSAQLAEVEVRRAKLAAQKAYTERLVALSREHASRLQADLNVQREQQQIVAGRQKQTRDEASVLQNEKDTAQAQLRAAQAQVRELQREADAGLPRTPR